MSSVSCANSAVDLKTWSAVPVRGCVADTGSGKTAVTLTLSMSSGL